MQGDAFFEVKKIRERDRERAREKERETERVRGTACGRREIKIDGNGSKIFESIQI